MCFFITLLLFRLWLTPLLSTPRPLRKSSFILSPMRWSHGLLWTWTTSEESLLRFRSLRISNGLMLLMSPSSSSSKTPICKATISLETTTMAAHRSSSETPSISQCSIISMLNYTFLQGLIKETVKEWCSLISKEMVESWLIWWISCGFREKCKFICLSLLW